MGAAASLTLYVIKPLADDAFLRKDNVHYEAMTELLEQAIERVRALPPDAQDDVARILLSLADGEQEPVALTGDERAAIAVSKAAAARGDFATDAEVRAVWAKHGL